MKNIAPTSLKIPEDLKSWLKKKAKQNRRSMSMEILALIDEAMQKDGDLI